jgi:integrase
MPIKSNFTQKYIHDLEPIPGKQFDVWDTKQPRFGLRVSPGGKKVFFVMRRVDGKLVRATVGDYPELNVDKARIKAAAMLVSMQEGNNPNAEKNKRRDQRADSRGILSSLFETYISGGGANGKMKATTATAYRYSFKRLARWHNLRVEEITPDMVKQLHADIGKKGEYVANHAIAVLRALMAYSIKEYNRPAANPCDGVRYFKESPRREAMPPETIPEFIKVLESLKGDTAADLYLMLLFTGMRKGEAMPLKWTDVDLVKKSLHIVETKNGNPLDIPISNHLAGILEKRKERIESKWIFPSNSRVGHITNTAQFDREIGTLGVKVYPHLLRKTFTTIAASICPGAIVDCLTGHIPQDVTGRHYTFPSVGQLRPHTEAITAEILRLTGEG